MPKGHFVTGRYFPLMNIKLGQANKRRYYIAYETL